MSTTAKDFQSDNISKSIKELIGYLNEENFKKVLEIETDAKSSEQFHLLNRLDQSLDQFLKRDRSLFHIGFLAIFSAGKSSTINSLLQLKGTKDQRLEELHPTDTQITMITNPKNLGEISKQTRGGLLPVAIQTIDNDYLLNKVILDTPGAGDPTVIEELVRDSLPLCDLIIYCIPSTSPFNNNDIPLLQEKEKNLKAIPTIYVITRGDHFKINPKATLNDENFDKVSSEAFLTKLSERMRSTTASISVALSDFVIIDNLEQFNVNLLRTRTDELATPDPQTIINLHAHKIDYFLNTAHAIKTYFSKTIDDKYSTINEYLEKAEKNVEEYNKKISIGSDKLINKWLTVDKIIAQIIDGGVGENTRILELLGTNLDLLKVTTIDYWRTDMINGFERENKIIADKIVQKLDSKAYDKKEALLSEMANMRLTNGSVSMEVLTEFLSSLKSQIIENEKQAVSFKPIFEQFQRKVSTYLTLDRLVAVKRIYDSVQKRIANKNPLEAVEKPIADAKQTLADIFQTYHETVRMYGIAAFSSETKNYIRKLGLSEDLDILDANLQKVTNYQHEAEATILKPYFEATDSFKTSCELLEAELNNTSLPQSLIDIQNADAELSAFKDEFELFLNAEILSVSEKYNTRASQFLIDEINSINSDLRNIELQKQEELKKLRQAKKRYYNRALIPVIGLLGLTIANFTLPTSFFGNTIPQKWQWVISITANAAFFWITQLFAKKNDKFPTLEEKVIDQYESNKIFMIIGKIDKDYNNAKIELKTEMVRVLYERLQEKSVLILAKLLAPAINTSLYSYNSSINHIEQQLKLVLTKYTKTMQVYKLGISRVLTNNSQNNDILFIQSGDLRKSTINPSFDLLNETAKNIGEIREKINQVSFIKSPAIV